MILAQMRIACPSPKGLLKLEIRGRPTTDAACSIMDFFFSCLSQVQETSVTVLLAASCSRGMRSCAFALTSHRLIDAPSAEDDCDSLDRTRDSTLSRATAQHMIAHTLLVRVRMNLFRQNSATKTHVRFAFYRGFTGLSRLTPDSQT